MSKTISKKAETTAKPAANASDFKFKLGSRNFTVSKEDGISAIVLVIVLFLVATIRSKFDMIPFERDEGIYGYMGKLLLDGGTPYKDFMEQKFPGLFYFYGAMVFLFGDTVKGLHTGFMLLNMISTVFIYLAARRLFSPIAGAIAACTFAFVSLTPNLSGFTVQAEHGVAFFISLGIFFYALYTSTRKWQYNLAMGLAFGLAIMTKTSGVFLVLWGGLVLITDFLFTKGDKSFKDLVVKVLTYSAGVLATVIFFFGLMWIKGSFDDMIYWAYTIPKSYVSKIAYEDGIKYFKYTRDAILENYKFFWWHAIAGFAVLFVKSVPFRLRAAAVLLLLFSFMTIVPGFYFYGHYWIQIIPGLAIMAGFTFHGLMQLLAGMNIKRDSLRYAYLGLFLILTFRHINANKSYYFHPNYERIMRGVYGSNPFPEAMEIGNYINANSKPEDDIVLLGSEPQIYFYTKKKCASRFAYFAALVNDVPEHKAWQREFVTAVEKQHPKYLVFFKHAISLFVQPNTDDYIFKWADKYINENFNLIGVADMVDGQQTTYVWKEALQTYQPKGGSIIFIYERKPENTKAQ